MCIRDSLCRRNVDKPPAFGNTKRLDFIRGSKCTSLFIVDRFVGGCRWDAFKKAELNWIAFNILVFSTCAVEGHFLNVMIAY